MHKETAPGNKLGAMPIGRLLVVMVAPMIVSYLGKALYNTVDTYFVSELGLAEMSAVTLAYSVQSILNAFATGLGIGLNPPSPGGWAAVTGRGRLTSLATASFWREEL